MASSFTFGSFPLTSANSISVSVVREKSPAERSLGLLQPARSIGIDVVSITPKAKIIEIEGTISVSGSLNTYTTTVRDFIAAMYQQADLQIGTTDGLFIYEDCVCLNPENMLRQEAHYNVNFLPFRLEILAPKGRAIATSLTSNTFSNISDSPYTNDVTIGGSLAAEPYITLTIDSTGGSNLSNITFLNVDTNESISVATNYQSGDVVQIDTKDKSVKYNTKNKRFTGLLPRFKLGDNKFKIDVESSETVHISQETSDSTRSVYGTNYLAQQINPDANISVAQIDLLIKRVEQTLFQKTLYDDCNDNSLNTSKWTTAGAGTITEQNGRIELSSTAPNSATLTSAETDFNGVKFEFGNTGNGTESESLSFYAQLSGNSLSILVQQFIQANTSGIRVNGVDVKTISGAQHVWEFKPVGSDIQIYADGTLQYTVTGQTFNSLGTFEVKCASPVNSRTIWVDNIEKYETTNAALNSDLTVEIRSDSTGVPAGSAITNGTAIVKASNISTSAFTIVPVTFTTAPSASDATDYHIVIYQSGGDVNNYYSVKVNTAGGYSQGNVETSSNSGSSWNEVSSEDLWMRVYSSFPTGFDIDAQIDYFVTHHSVV